MNSNINNATACTTTEDATDLLHCLTDLLLGHGNVTSFDSLTSIITMFRDGAGAPTLPPHLISNNDMKKVLRSYLVGLGKKGHLVRSIDNGTWTVKPNAEKELLK